MGCDLIVISLVLPTLGADWKWQGLSYTALVDYLDNYDCFSKTFILSQRLNQLNLSDSYPKALDTAGHFTVNNSYSYNKRSNLLYNYIKNNEKL